MKMRRGKIVRALAALSDVVLGSMQTRKPGDPSPAQTGAEDLRIRGLTGPDGNRRRLSLATRAYQRILREAREREEAERAALAGLTP